PGPPGRRRAVTRARDAMEHQGHYAGPVSRLLAYAVDVGVLGVVYTAGLALLRFAVDAATPWKLNIDGAVFTVGAFLWAALYFGASWVGFARSPGMSLLGLRIVRGDGADLDRRHALIRLVAFPLGWLTLGIGFLPIVAGRTRQAIYDRLADTAVVYDWDAEAAKLRELATRGGHRRALGGAPDA
ncbi:MAG TPA: RDD family protein, partial [Conexibacter sp.]|nr:RDD family protein [Conexibacter sp.]